MIYCSELHSLFIYASICECMGKGPAIINSRSSLLQNETESMLLLARLVELNKPGRAAADLGRATDQ